MGVCEVRQFGCLCNPRVFEDMALLDVMLPALDCGGSGAGPWIWRHRCSLRCLLDCICMTVVYCAVSRVVIIAFEPRVSTANLRSESAPWRRRERRAVDGTLVPKALPMANRLTKICIYSSFETQTTIILHVL